MHGAKQKNLRGKYGSKQLGGQFGSVVEVYENRDWVIIDIYIYTYINFYNFFISQFFLINSNIYYFL